VIGFLIGISTFYSFITMRHGRSKAARRTLQFFRRTIALTPPYHVILDGTFLVAVLRYKLQDEIRDRLAKLLQLDPTSHHHHQSQQHQSHNNNHHSSHQQNQQSLYCHVPRSSLLELENLLTSLQETTTSKPPKGEVRQQHEQQVLLLERARQWGLDESDEVLETIADADEKRKDHSSTNKTTAKSAASNRQTSHETNPESSLSLAAQDILRFVEEQQDMSTENAHSGKSSKNRRSKRVYLVASQDEQLLYQLRRVGRVPCIHLARGGVLLLQSPSQMAVGMAQHEERVKWNATDDHVGLSLESTNDDDETGKVGIASASKSWQKPRVLKRKAKGPNPLSCKKKKVEQKQPPPRPKTTSSTKPASTPIGKESSTAKPSSRRKRRTTREESTGESTGAAES
jgi:U3 small nucleolar RNA-associated protein 23